MNSHGEGQQNVRMPILRREISAAVLFLFTLAGLHVVLEPQRILSLQESDARPKPAPQNQEQDDGTSGISGSMLFELK